MTFVDPMATISSPAVEGPTSDASRLPPSISAFACPTACSSSPTISGRTTRWAAKYGALKQPTSATITRSSGSERTPAACSTGIDAISGARAKSATSIARRAPSREMNVPLGMPRIAIGASPAAITRPIRAVDPVVWSTNQGNARNHIAEQGPDAECRHEQAGDARVGAEPRDDQHGHADEERRPAGVPDREHRCPDPQQRLTGEKADPSPDAAVFTVGRERLRPRHQPGDQRR